MRISDWSSDVCSSDLPDGGSAVVSLTHDPKLDDPALARALNSPAFYIGALGSRKTHAARLERLGAAGFTDKELARIHGPAGLPIGAAGPAEIAVRSEEHTSELQSLMRISYAVFCLKKKNNHHTINKQ